MGRLVNAGVSRGDTLSKEELNKLDDMMGKLTGVTARKLIENGGVRQDYSIVFAVTKPKWFPDKLFRRAAGYITGVTVYGKSGERIFTTLEQDKTK